METRTATTLDPKILGFWTRCMRETAHISQDALAVASRLNLRTIQRIESGHAVNLTTRRCLARGLGYVDQDKFDDPEFIATVTGLLSDLAVQQLNEQHPDCIRIKAARIISGDALARLAETSNAFMPTADDNLSASAKETAAALFDFLRDMMDLGERSYADRVSHNDSLDTLRRALEEQGAVLYAASRPVKTSSESWQDRTPISFMIGYLAAVPKGSDIRELMVPKRFQLG